MELMAEQFPGAFAGYRLQVVESHQRSKVDTSGTARAIVQSFQKLGLDFEEVRCLACRGAGAWSGASPSDGMHDHLWAGQLPVCSSDGISTIAPG